MKCQCFEKIYLHGCAERFRITAIEIIIKCINFEDPRNTTISLGKCCILKLFWTLTQTNSSFGSAGLKSTPPLVESESIQIIKKI